VPKRVVVLGGGPVVVHTDDGMRLETDEILVATGRRPVTGDIGLETLGLTSSGPLAVDDSMRVTGVSDGWLYAVGDVNGRNGTCPCGSDPGRRRHLLRRGFADYR
jgi:pyruvate/2-oxoglutarate dehydrogenase complex dihydrolipoamide dehydrogenase (E3) component